jgi:hypothetical protein
MSLTGMSAKYLLGDLCLGEAKSLKRLGELL